MTKVIAVMNAEHFFDKYDHDDVTRIMENLLYTKAAELNLEIEDYIQIFDSEHKNVKVWFLPLYTDGPRYVIKEQGND